MGVRRAVKQQHITASSLQQVCQDVRWCSGTILAEDALVGDAASDGHAGKSADLAKNLIEAGVVRGDLKLALNV